MNNWDFDCAIIGGGPGGLVSALYLARFRRKIALFNSGQSRAHWAPRIHNLIGYEKGIPGRHLLTKLDRQISQFSNLSRIKLEAQIRQLSQGGFELTTSDQSRTRAKTVILATGIDDIQPKLDNLKQLRNFGLLRYCSICDGYEMRGQPVTVLVQDDFGIQKAVFLGNWTHNIRILIPQNLRLSPRRVKEIKSIQAQLISYKTFYLERSHQGNTVWVHTDQNKPYLSSVVYVELGCRVNDSAFKKLNKLWRTKEGFITTTTEQRTSMADLFAVGDCVNLLGQISVAAGQAAVAATTIHNDLLERT